MKMEHEIIYELKIENKSRTASSWTRYFQAHPTIDEIVALYLSQEKWTWSILELTPEQLQYILVQDVDYLFFPFDKDIWGREDIFQGPDGMEISVSVSMKPLFKNK